MYILCRGLVIAGKAPSIVPAGVHTLGSTSFVSTVPEYILYHHYLRELWSSQTSTIGSVEWEIALDTEQNAEEGMRKVTTGADQGAKWELDGGRGDPRGVTHQQALRTLSLCGEANPKFWVWNHCPYLSLSSWPRISFWLRIYISMSSFLGSLTPPSHTVSVEGDIPQILWRHQDHWYWVKWWQEQFCNSFLLQPK